MLHRNTAILHNMAMGIPDRSDFGDPGKLQVGALYDLIVQNHLARRAGPHKDIRLGDPNLGLLSWATKKGLPEPGERRMLYGQPVHAYDYKDYEGALQGYGAGTVSKESEQKVLVTRVDPGTVQFTTAGTRNPERFTLVRPKGDSKNWLVINTTSQVGLGIPKVKFQSVPADVGEEILSDLTPGSAVQPKVDGAAVLAKLLDHSVELYSQRLSVSGKPIIHSERVFENRNRLDIPRDLVGSVLRGELYGERGGKAIPVQELGGILNSTLSNALSTKRETGTNLRVMAHDIEQLGKNPVDPESTPYAERLGAVRRVLDALNLPDTFHMPESAESSEAAKALLARIRSNEHPLTNEGVVIHPPTGKPTKIKLTAEHDVHVQDIFPGEGKLTGMAGGIRYSLDPAGPAVGEVGSGFSHATLADLSADPEAYKGRVARIRAQSQFPSGAYRAPSFLAWHEDYPAKTAGERLLAAT